MNYLLMSQTWLVLAVIFSLAEIVIPGGILINLGLAAVIVALGISLGILDTWILTLICWFISASILLFVINFITNRYFAGELHVDNTDESFDLYGKEVLVLETIGPGNQKGRVAFQDTTWTALGDGSEIAAGSRVRIICQDNISLVVEQVS